jgi:hypothetical protein
VAQVVSLADQDLVAYLASVVSQVFLDSVAQVVSLADQDLAVYLASVVSLAVIQ